MMKKLLFSVTVLILMSSFTLGQSDRKTAVAVMNLKGSGISEQDTKFLTDRLTIELQRTGTFDVLERDKMSEILKEQGFQQTGACDETACLVEAGRMLPVQKMIGGSLGKIGDVYAAQLRLIDLKTGKVEMTSARDYKGQMEFLLTVGMREVSEELSGKLKAQAQTPVQTQTTPQTEVMMQRLLEGQAQQEYKSKGWGLFWSLVIPGAGNFYAKSYGRSAFFFLGSITAQSAFTVQALSDNSSGAGGWGLAYVVLRVADIVVANRSVNRYNQNVRKKYGLTYEFLPQNKEIKTALSVQF
jgi:curli biogenesis system outer membrane secretion channel CsgG